VHSEPSNEEQSTPPHEFKRRSSDKKQMPAGGPSNEDIWDLLIEIRDRVIVLERKTSDSLSAFPSNDLGRPDYDGHRKSHLSMIKASEVVEGYKKDVTKTILGIVTVFLVGVLASGFVSSLVTSIKNTTT